MDKINTKTMLGLTSSISNACTTLNSKRDDMMIWLKDTLQSQNNSSHIFVGTSADFYSNDMCDGIHLCAEDGAKYNGQLIYDYYSMDTKERDCGILKSWEKIINSKGYYSEWYDGGTVILNRI
mgnify:FL=1|tara:strand:- start:202 stop:570 length:369 start_codon:yes stop_codon:yes gene_type:complete